MTHARSARLPLSVAAGLALAAGGSGADLHAQSRGLSVEVGAARTFPPSGTDAPQANYALAGLRLEVPTGWEDGLWATVHGGRSLESVGSDFWSTGAGGSLRWTIAGPLSLRLAVEGNAFGVSDPYTYRTWSATASPSVVLGAGPMRFLLNGQMGTGRSVIEVRRTDLERLRRNGLDRATDVTPVRRAERELWHRGGGPEVQWVGRRHRASMSAARYETPRGRYQQVRGALLGSAGAFVWQVSVSGWDTPAGRHTAGGVTLRVPLGSRFSSQASGARTEPDPLVGTDATAHGGAFLQGRILDLGGRPRAAVYELGRDDAGSHARFRLERPDAMRVQVLGDFTHWEPVSMRVADGAWTASVPVEPGVYHFGFLVDGEWYLPEEGIPGRVSDEWGRENGTLVVPEEWER